MKLIDQLLARDSAAFARVAASKSPGLDAVLPRLTKAANHGVLWWAVASGVGLTGRAHRRAAMRGLLSLGIASAVSNVPAKLSVRRPRPSLVDVPAHRQLGRQPITTSFPSGHSASAAAFAVGVALETPGVGAVVGVLASAVAYSRIYVGVHYPGDVLAGVTIGVGSALLTVKLWPLHPEDFAR